MPHGASFNINASLKIGFLADVPLATKASNILAYSQEQLGPLLRSMKDVVLAKKAEAQEFVEEQTTSTTSG